MGLLQTAKVLIDKRRGALCKRGQAAAVQLEVARAALLHRFGDGRATGTEGGRLAQSPDGITKVHGDLVQLGLSGRRGALPDLDHLCTARDETA